MPNDNATAGSKFCISFRRYSMGNLTGEERINTTDKVGGCVIATSKGYPHEYKTGFPIKIGELTQVIVKFSTQVLLSVKMVNY